MLKISPVKSIFPRLRSLIVAGGYRLSPRPTVDPTVMRPACFDLVKVPVGTKIESFFTAVLPQHSGVVDVGVDGIDFIAF